MTRKNHKVNVAFEVIKAVKIRKKYVHDLARHGKTPERVDLLETTSSILYLCMNVKNLRQEVSQLKRKIRVMEKKNER